MRKYEYIDAFSELDSSICWEIHEGFLHLLGLAKTVKELRAVPEKNVQRESQHPILVMTGCCGWNKSHTGWWDLSLV